MQERPVWQHNCRFTNLKDPPEPLKTRRKDLPLMADLDGKHLDDWIRRKDNLPRNEMYKFLYDLEQLKEPLNLNITECKEIEEQVQRQAEEERKAEMNRLTDARKKREKKKKKY